MNNQEFQLWWDHAVVVIPSLADWLGKIKKHPDKDWKKVLRFWQDRLSRVELSGAKDAIEKLAQDSPPKYNRDYEGIPFAISRMTSATHTMSPSQFVDGQQTVKCRECQDEGLIDVWEARSVKVMREGTFGTPTKGHGCKFGYGCVVRCTCEAGQRRPDRIQTFDSSQHCRCENVQDVDSIEALREFCNPHNRAKEMSGYDSSLAAYNQEPF